MSTTRQTRGVHGGVVHVKADERRRRRRGTRRRRRGTRRRRVGTRRLAVSGWFVGNVDPVRLARAVERAVDGGGEGGGGGGGRSRGRGGGERGGVGGEVQATRRPRAGGGVEDGRGRGRGRRGRGRGRRRVVPRGDVLVVVRRVRADGERVLAASTESRRRRRAPVKPRVPGEEFPEGRARRRPGRGGRPVRRRRGRAQEIVHAQGTALLTQGRGSSAEHPKPAHAPRVVVLPVVVRAGRDVGGRHGASTRVVPSGARASARPRETGGI